MCCGTHVASGRWRRLRRLRGADSACTRRARNSSTTGATTHWAHEPSTFRARPPSPIFAHTGATGALVLRGTAPLPLHLFRRMGDARAGRGAEDEGRGESRWRSSLHPQSVAPSSRLAPLSASPPLRRRLRKRVIGRLSRNRRRQCAGRGDQGWGAEMSGLHPRGRPVPSCALIRPPRSFVLPSRGSAAARRKKESAERRAPSVRALLLAVVVEALAALDAQLAGSDLLLDDAHGLEQRLVLRRGRASGGRVRRPWLGEGTGRALLGVERERQTQWV